MTTRQVVELIIAVRDGPALSTPELASAWQSRVLYSAVRVSGQQWSRFVIKVLMILGAFAHFAISFALFSRERAQDAQSCCLSRVAHIPLCSQGLGLILLFTCAGVSSRALDSWVRGFLSSLYMPDTTTVLVLSQRLWSMHVALCRHLFARPKLCGVPTAKNS